MYLHSYVVVSGCSVNADAIYGITWPTTMVNENATNNCPNATGMDM